MDSSPASARGGKEFEDFGDIQNRRQAAICGEIANRSSRFRIGFVSCATATPEAILGHFETSVSPIGLLGRFRKVFALP